MDHPASEIVAMFDRMNDLEVPLDGDQDETGDRSVNGELGAGASAYDETRDPVVSSNSRKFDDHRDNDEEALEQVEDSLVDDEGVGSSASIDLGDGEHEQHEAVGYQSDETDQTQ